MTNEDHEALLHLLSKLLDSTEHQSIIRVAKSLFNLLTRDKYKNSS